MKRYLLIAGSCYYPEAGTGDWIKCFETRDEAENYLTRILLPKEVFSRGPRKGQEKPDQLDLYMYTDTKGSYERRYDWYEVVDLVKWIYPNNEEIE